MHVAMGPWHILQLTSCHHILGFVMYWKCCSTVMLYLFKETPWCTCLWKPFCTSSGKHPGVLAYWINPVVHVQGNTLVYLLMELTLLYMFRETPRCTCSGNPPLHLLRETLAHAQGNSLVYLFRETPWCTCSGKLPGVLVQGNALVYLFRETPWCTC